jgi:glycerophosphoryl diester phosphodiesterase
VQISCHRGANRYAPENTVASIRTAAELGADYVEIDIRTTSDGRFVLLHDGKLDRTTAGKGPVGSKTCDEITALTAGAWFGKPFADAKVPTFDAGLSALGDKSHVYLDAKDITPEKLLAAIRKHRLMERHVVYQSPGYCEKLKALEAEVRVLPPLKKITDFDSVAKLKPYGVDANWSILSKEMIAKCHAAGIRVFSDALGWHETVADYRQAIGWGIDVIQTDHPLRVLRAIELDAAARR